MDNNPLLTAAHVGFSRSFVHRNIRPVMVQNNLILLSVETQTIVVGRPKPQAKTLLSCALLKVTEVMGSTAGTSSLRFNGFKVLDFPIATSHTSSLIIAEFFLTVTSGNRSREPTTGMAASE